MFGEDCTTRSQIWVVNDSPELVFAQTVYVWLLDSTEGVPEIVQRELLTEIPCGKDGETSQEEIEEITGRQEPGSFFTPFPVPCSYDTPNRLFRCRAKEMWKSSLLSATTEVYSSQPPVQLGLVV